MQQSPQYTQSDNSDDTRGRRGGDVEMVEAPDEEIGLRKTKGSPLVAVGRKETSHGPGGGSSGSLEEGG